MPSYVHCSFEENLKVAHKSYNFPEDLHLDPRMPDPKNPVIKYIIPRKEFDQIRLVLSHMNITAASLFPDLDGFCKSMNEIAKQWRVEWIE